MAPWLILVGDFSNYAWLGSDNPLSDVDFPIVALAFAIFRLPHCRTLTTDGCRWMSLRNFRLYRVTIMLQDLHWLAVLLGCNSSSRVRFIKPFAVWALGILRPKGQIFLSDLWKTGTIWLSSMELKWCELGNQTRSLSLHSNPVHGSSQNISWQSLTSSIGQVPQLWKFASPHWSDKVWVCSISRQFASLCSGFSWGVSWGARVSAAGGLGSLIVETLTFTIQLHACLASFNQESHCPWQVPCAREASSHFTNWHTLILCNLPQRSYGKPASELGTEPGGLLPNPCTN